MKKILLVTILSALLCSSCSILGGVKKSAAPLEHTISLNVSRQPQVNKYINMDYGIRLNVTDKRETESVLNKFEAAGSRPIMSTYPDVLPFVTESMTDYMRTMGFPLNSDINTDYLLQLDITKFQISFLSGTGWVATVAMNVQVFDAGRKQVYPTTVVTGRAMGKVANLSASTSVMNDAYTKALENIDWDRLAYFLRRAKNASEEKNKQVQGNGDTALEHTVIRWYVDSSPKGADVQWRVVSSTPDVKNTNQNFLGSTPYESTETFDIKGLTFNNSGNIQIEVSCEKPGYITQKKRFNLRQVIEQKEISTKFNLVKEEL